MTLTDAISAVESASSAYSSAQVQTTNDQTIAAGIQAKLDAATATVATDKQAQTDAGSAFNSSLDALIAAASAAKIS